MRIQHFIALLACTWASGCAATHPVPKTAPVYILRVSHQSPSQGFVVESDTHVSLAPGASYRRCLASDTAPDNSIDPFLEDGCVGPFIALAPPESVATPAPGGVRLHYTVSVRAEEPGTVTVAGRRTSRATVEGVATAQYGSPRRELAAVGAWRVELELTHESIKEDRGPDASRMMNRWLGFQPANFE
ncbi:hypothetical protein F6X40_36295 [Paraburkholderia sp. UCT31]|uniref:hypothetical protein n=1 Tax=Paraburkholderia sp. UCT31 TaxID=2615209 RepID=UPI0016556F08|nr:hypothetical protein [Paraburkholderia sp. UCT31]MBC8742002.1 hypothetical protein [Paraburkholderia sp. UCT31]